jgi:hypothetical protein
MPKTFASKTFAPKTFAPKIFAVGGRAPTPFETPVGGIAAGSLRILTKRTLGSKDITSALTRNSSTSLRTRHTAKS